MKRRTALERGSFEKSASPKPQKGNLLQDIVCSLDIVFNFSAFVPRQHSHYGFIHDVHSLLADGL